MLQTDNYPVFLFEVVRCTAGRALEKMHGVKAGGAGLAVYGVDGETVVLFCGKLFDERHVEVFFSLDDLAVDKIGIEHVKADQEHEIVAVLDGQVQKLHGASIVDVDEIIDVGNIRIATVDAHIGPVFGKSDGAEQ